MGSSLRSHHDRPGFQLRWVAATAITPLIAGVIAFAVTAAAPSGIDQGTAQPAPSVAIDVSDPRDPDVPALPADPAAPDSAGPISQNGADETVELNDADLQDAREVLRLTNLERATYGLPGLEWNDLLAQIAVDYAVEMIEYNFFSHTGHDGSEPNERATRAGYVWGFIGENLAMGQRTPAEAMDGWMNSPGHRANILRPDFTELGVGRVGNHWVQMFGTPRSGG